jgi:hypothetical protein
MKNSTLWGTALACAMTIGLAAQAPPAGSTQTPPTTGAQSAQSSDAKHKVTVTGCLEKASASSTGATAGASASADTAKFVLNKVTADSSSASGTAGAAGTSGSAHPTASSYRIDGDDSKLTPHVGHKVAITGSVDSASASGSTGGASASASAAGPKLKVDSVKMIAASCTE